MVTLSDGSYHGHFGFDFSCAGGGFPILRDLVDKFMQPARICYCCILEPYRETDTNQAACAYLKKKMRTSTARPASRPRWSASMT